MGKKSKKRGERNGHGERERLGFWSGLRAETRGSILGIACVIIAVILLLAANGKGGYLGEKIYLGAHFFFGVGYYAIPLLCALLAVNFFRAGGHNLAGPALVAGPFFLLSTLGLLALFDHTHGVNGLGGFVGYYSMLPVVSLFAPLATGVIFAAVLLVAILILFDTPLRLGFVIAFFNLLRRQEDDAFAIRHPKEKGAADTYNIGGDDESNADKSENIENEPAADENDDADDHAAKNAEAEVLTAFDHHDGRREKKQKSAEAPFRFNSTLHSAYVPPPLSLLSGDKGKPGYGDIKANANIIKRTLQNFGIHVEMDEAAVGPSITRYALKPAEGIRIAKIVTLQRDLELALAAAPIRIEAPIPGKSLVGIEIPNSVKSTVGLGTLLAETAWSENPNPLYVPLGKGISGIVQFMNIGKMPHVLVAGATGSGKSVAMHTMITSLLYRNSPEHMRLIMIDPKRVELTSYNGIPHLLTPVITDAKKAILTLKWAAKEMDRRYDVLEEEKCRDIESYHKSILQPALEQYEKQKADEGRDESDEPELPDLMPYIVIIIDELADIMVAYPRELEAAIVRLAQMSRAVGIHLILSTQRPSVDIITGLIKANIPARIALQVASQIDSRTILDMSGAENLLGAGDMLFLSAEMPKPIRLQSAFISEAEVKNIVKFLRDHYDGTLGDELNLTNTENKNAFFGGIPEEALVEGEEGDDEKYEEAKELVISSGKASTSFLQRRLGLGYARAARMMDILEERGVVGPGSGAKPREVLMKPETLEGFGREEKGL